MPKAILRPESLSFQPRPTYPYSPGAMADGWIWTAGQVAWDRTARIVGPNDAAAQTRQVLSNIAAILAEGGAGLKDVVAATVYLADIRHFDAMDRVWVETFGPAAPPRTVVRARLAEPEMLVEIEATARQP
ncbi:MAG: RidA family protein [Pikeienuella sp.]|uniref:RidA family protein n=1 Tax=Pikeienuella sp. TaxID=2831957 RepID=UPI0039187DB7